MKTLKDILMLGVFGLSGGLLLIAAMNWIGRAYHDSDNIPRPGKLERLWKGEALTPSTSVPSRLEQEK